MLTLLRNGCHFLGNHLVGYCPRIGHIGCRHSHSLLRVHILQRRGFGTQTFSVSDVAFHGIDSRAFWPTRAPMHVEAWASEQVTSVSVREFCNVGTDFEGRARVEYARFLQRELCIRMSKAAIALRSLPAGLAEKDGVREVITKYEDSVADIDASHRATFPELLDRLFQEHTEDICGLARGLHDSLAKRSGETTSSSDVEEYLADFLMKRISIRLLMKHYLLSRSGSHRGQAGVFQLQCRPGNILRKAADASVALCRSVLGQSPAILIHDETPTCMRFAAVPLHLQYVLTEVLKNACRAVVERHGDFGYDDDLPPVQCTVVCNSEEVVLRISDQGGGIPQGRMNDVWKFMYSTNKVSPFQSEGLLGNDPVSGPARAQKPQRRVLAGYGFGLGLSQLHVRYLGGELLLKSAEGSGTHVILHLKRCASRRETLHPTRVNDFLHGGMPCL